MDWWCEASGQEQQISYLSSSQEQPISCLSSSQEQQISHLPNLSSSQEERIQHLLDLSSSQEKRIRKLEELVQHLPLPNLSSSQEKRIHKLEELVQHLPLPHKIPKVILFKKEKLPNNLKGEWFAANLAKTSSHRVFTGILGFCQPSNSKDNKKLGVREVYVSFLVFGSGALVVNSAEFCPTESQATLSTYTIGSEFPIELAHHDAGEPQAGECQANMMEHLLKISFSGEMPLAAGPFNILFRLKSNQGDLTIQTPDFKYPAHQSFPPQVANFDLFLACNLCCTDEVEKLVWYAHKTGRNHPALQVLKNPDADHEYHTSSWKEGEQKPEQKTMHIVAWDKGAKKSKSGDEGSTRKAPELGSFLALRTNRLEIDDEASSMEKDVKEIQTWLSSFRAQNQQKHSGMEVDLQNAPNSRNRSSKVQNNRLPSPMFSILLFMVVFASFSAINFSNPPQVKNTILKIARPVYHSAAICNAPDNSKCVRVTYGPRRYGLFGPRERCETPDHECIRQQNLAHQNCLKSLPDMQQKLQENHKKATEASLVHLNAPLKDLQQQRSNLEHKKDDDLQAQAAQCPKIVQSWYKG